MVTLLAVAALGVPVLGLAGCSGDGAAAGPRPSSTTSPTASASPSPSESAQPESPEEFIRRWASANNEMKETGNSTDFLRLTRGCVPCRDLADLVGSFYSAGGFVETRGWMVGSIEGVDASDPRRPVYLLRVHSSPTKYQETASSEVQKLKGGDFTYRVTLVKVGKSWNVTDYIQVSQ